MSQLYVTELPAVALDAETMPFAGAAAPVQDTGMSQLVPIQPASQVPQVYPFVPIGMQPLMLCTHGSGVHAMFTIPLELAVELALEVEVEVEVEVELEVAPPAPLELEAVPPAPPEPLLDVVVMPPAPLELLVAADIVPVPLELLAVPELAFPPAPVPPAVLLPCEEPQPAATKPSATTGIATERREEEEIMIIYSSTTTKKRRGQGDEEGRPVVKPLSRHSGSFEASEVMPRRLASRV
jgi:hypothetical protein